MKELLKSFNSTRYNWETRKSIVRTASRKVSIPRGTIESNNSNFEVYSQKKFQFHEVQLRDWNWKKKEVAEESFNSTRYNWEANLGQALEYQCLVSIPRGTIESYGWWTRGSCFFMFQFHEVQLRAFREKENREPEGSFNSTRYNWELCLEV